MEIRPITPEELEAFSRALGTAFGFESRPEGVDALGMALEVDRTLAVFDGSEIVGTAGAYTFDITVPGGRLPMAGTTVVSVQPTHRRRGLMRKLMARHLADVVERGEPLAGLWASESSIYRRFGYGSAAARHDLSIDTRSVGLEAPPYGSVRLVRSTDVVGVLTAVYERCRPSRPGMLSRSEAWWQRRLVDPEWERGGGTPFRFAIWERDGEALGYAQYRQHLDWVDGNPAGRVELIELMTASPDAYQALWSFLLGIDLSTTLTAFNRPVDEALPWMVAEPRRIRQSRVDSLWLRPILVPALLEGRRYAMPGSLTLRVVDPFEMAGAGVYHLEGGPDGATCVASNREPDLEMEVADLGAIYLGGVSPGVLASAGRIRGAASALQAADRMFAWWPAPWCPEVF